MLRQKNQITKYVFYLFAILLTVSCSRYSSGLEWALKQAGDNRAELEKVLEHYCQTPEDSLKLKAAEFLITNMPYHYTLSNAVVDSFRLHIASHTPGATTISDFEEQFGPLANLRYQRLYDINVMTADYLIRNIDFSFRLWHEAPWGKHISFDNFCEEILPYRVGNEPLENWKEVYYERYRPMLDTVANGHDPVAVAGMLFKHLYNNEDWALVYDYNLNTPDLGALALLDMRWGLCREQVSMFVYTMRSVGIPTGILTYVQAPDMVTAHEWNYMRDTTGKAVGFDYYNTKIFGEDIIDHRKRGKVFRKYFQLQKESLPILSKSQNIPPKLNNEFIKEVSSEYLPDNMVEISVDKKFRNGDFMYLSVFNNTTWVPMAWSNVENGKVQFRYLQPDVLYQISDYKLGQVIPVSAPFVMNRNGTADFLVADTVNNQSVRLLRKHYYPEWWERTRICAIGGRFQGANKPDFSDAVTLYTIPDKAEMLWENIPLNNMQTFNYARYITAVDGRNYIAEIEFYDGDVKLSGKPVGTEGSHLNDPDKTSDKAFDSEPLTYYRAEHEIKGSWTGLEFEQPHRITSIRYLFRNDDNNIRPGDAYELVYWAEDGRWRPLGHQVAGNSYELHFDSVPTGALFLLHNHTRGKEERPFTYENGEQIWW
ncbi:MAG: hypothetical protein LBV47_07870 [Bacteroidales bacterium]|jgi:hypothetical protein|nr:hypothetical protein [Bacteroidales bacterium]